VTENEIKLINIVRERENPVQALIIAINVIVSYLVQHESYPKPLPVVPREQV
jgi:hypothetical protein